MNRLAKVGLALCLISCSKTERVEPVQEVLIEIKDTQGGQVLDAEVLVDGNAAQVVGHMDEALLIELSPSQNMARDIRVACPGGDETQNRIFKTDGFSEDVIPRLTFECPMTESRVALLVSTHMPSIGLMLDGAPVGDTDESGNAYLSFVSTPGEVHHIRMDSNQEAKIDPSFHERSLTVPQRDALIVIEQEFRKVKIKRKKPNKKKSGPVQFITL